jgi:isochorismate synthase EntC
MAGTAPAGADAEALAALVASTKDAWEHRLVVDAVRAVLAPRCHELSAPTTPVAERFSSLAHLATMVAGELLAPAPDALSLARLLHPTPAVGGTPTAAALATIRRLEPFDRGRYAGPVGWVDARGDGAFAVALRGAELDGQLAVLRAGAGIVAGSDPDSEWAETGAKLEPMLRALIAL